MPSVLTNIRWPNGKGPAPSEDRQGLTLKESSAQVLEVRPKQGSWPSQASS